MEFLGKKPQILLIPIYRTTDMIMMAMSYHCPNGSTFFLAVIYTIPTVHWNKRKMKHWFSDSTIKLIHKKKQLYRRYKCSAALRRYKVISNLARSKCHQETIAHSNLVCHQNNTNPKQLWRWIKVIGASSLRYMTVKTQ